LLLLKKLLQVIDGHEHFEKEWEMTEKKKKKKKYKEKKKKKKKRGEYLTHIKTKIG